MSGKRLFILFVASAGAVILWVSVNRFAPNTIEYRGERIKLTRYYLDYDDYKNDADNIDPLETTRVQQLVAQAPIARSFKNRLEIATAVGEIAFPGYGSGGFGDGIHDGPLTGFSVEIPRSEEARYIIFRETATGYLLIDDFRDSSMPGINHVEEKDGKLIYSMDGRPERLTRAIHDFP